VELRQRRYFKAIADARSFVRAAGQLCVAQPALSRSIARLEEEVGQLVFVRHAGGVALTDAGLHLYEHATNILRRVQAMKDEMAAEVATPHGVVSFGAPASLQSVLAAPVVAEFLMAFPRVTLNVVQNTSVYLRDAVTAGHVDVAIVSALTPSRGLRLLPLATEGFCLVERADFPQRFDGVVDVASLAGIPLLLCGYPNLMRLFLEDVFEQMDAKPNFRCEVTTSSLLLDLVMEGAGAAVVPSCAVASRNLGGNFRITPIRQLEVSWAIATSLERAGSACVTQLSTMITQHVKDLISSAVWPTARFDGAAPPVGHAV
jgi:LysR family transcriptional regulator, nitrogen assimilation regulatory protein